VVSLFLLPTIGNLHLIFTSTFTGISFKYIDPASFIVSRKIVAISSATVAGPSKIISSWTVPISLPPLSCSFDTLQFTDYSKVVVDRFDAEKKTRRHLEVFPKDCGKALALGMRFAQDMDG